MPPRSASTLLDARDSDRNQTIWNARLVLATTGLHLAQFRHKHRPLAKAVDYAEIFIYDEAQQEAALSDIAILGALPRKCLLLHLGDPKQTSGGTAPGKSARCPTGSRLGSTTFRRSLAPAPRDKVSPGAWRAGRP